MRQKIKYYAAWVPAVTITALALGKYFYPDKIAANSTVICLLGSFLVQFLLWSGNRARVENGRELSDIGLLEGISSHPDQYTTDTGRQKAMHPKVSSAILYDQPCGVCFGKSGRQYVCRAPEAEGAVLLCGGSGSGKSRCGIMPFLLLNKNRMNSLVFDLKGELSAVTVKPGDSAVIFDPTDHVRGWGYNPFFALGNKPTDFELFQTMQQVAEALIPIQKGEEYWGQSASLLFLGCLIYFYKYESMRTLPEILRAILSAPIEQTIASVVETAANDSNEYRALIDFYGMASDTLSGVFSNLKTAVFELASDEDLNYALEGAVQRFSPETLLKDSVYLKIPVHKLRSWNKIVLLIINQTLNWMMSLPEHADDPQRPQMAVVWDEFTATLSGLGRVPDSLLQALRYIRSKGVLCILACQSLSGMRCIMSEEELEDLLSNCAWQLYFDAGTKTTQDFLIQSAGTFRCRNESWSGSGKDRKITISYSDESILRGSDLIQLPQKQECILISRASGYSCLKKTHVNFDPELKKLL